MTYAAKGNYNTAVRIVQAQSRMIATIADLANLSQSDAAKAFETLRAVKAIKLDIVGGSYIVKHGAFMDAEVLRRAVNHEVA